MITKKNWITTLVGFACLANLNADTLIGNYPAIDQGGGLGIGGGAFPSLHGFAVGFHTPAGVSYTLDNVRFFMRLDNSESGSLGMSVDFNLYQDSGGNPGPFVASLGSNTMGITFADIIGTPGASVLLFPDTSYWVTITGIKPPADTWEWSTGQNNTVASGIASFLGWRLIDGENIFPSISPEQNGKFQIVGTPFSQVPEASTSAAAALVAVLTWGYWSRRKAK